MFTPYKISNLSLEKSMKPWPNFQYLFAWHGSSTNVFVLLQLWPRLLEVTWLKMGYHRLNTASTISRVDLVVSVLTPGRAIAALKNPVHFVVCVVIVPNQKHTMVHMRSIAISSAVDSASVVWDLVTVDENSEGAFLRKTLLDSYSGLCWQLIPTVETCRVCEIGIIFGYALRHNGGAFRDLQRILTFRLKSVHMVDKPISMRWFTTWGATLIGSLVLARSNFLNRKWEGIDILINSPHALTILNSCHSPSCLARCSDILYWCNLALGPPVKCTRDRC
mmetsp:Transcript_15669/g.23017  ORF Transcript_15669/g.23017 Transcript_15669/m.23017 type:complete len:278 (-) Transcript_15669:684-1517(-)